MKKLLVVLLVLCFAAPAAAADWHFYGSIRGHLGYYDADQEYAGGPGMDGTIGTNWDDDSGTLLSIGGQSRFGVKAIASETLYGVIEYGLTNSTRDQKDVNNPYLRLAYGVWDFGAGKLSVGKQYGPAGFLGYSRMNGDIGDQGDANMLVAGCLYSPRDPQIKFTFGDLDISFIEQNKNANDYGGDIDFYLPKIEASYVFRTELVNIRPVVGFQTYDVEFQGGGDETIDSYMVGIGASFDLKPAYIKATAAYTQNSANYGRASLGAIVFREAVMDVTGDLNDSDYMQGTLVAGFNVNKMLSLEGGIGYMNSEVDLAPGVTGEQTAMVYYLQAWIAMAKGFYVIPEIGMLDRGDLEVSGQPDVDLGQLTYFDLGLRMDF